MSAISMTASNRSGIQNQRSLVPFALKTTMVDAGTNLTIQDESTLANVATVTGTGVAQGSTGPFRAPQGYWSMALSGAGGEGVGCYCPTAANLATGTTADFTWECWILRSWQTSNLNCVASIATGSNQVALRFSNAGITAGFASNILAYTGPAFDPAAQAGKWVHIVFSRQGGTTRFFINGKLMVSATGDQNNYNFSGVPAVVGQYNGAGSQEFIGYLSNLRIDIGAANYTAEAGHSVGS